MLTYAFVPFAIMLTCSVIIIYKLYGTDETYFLKENKTKNGKIFRTITFIKSDSEHVTREISKIRRREQSLMPKERQVTCILLITNFLFFCLVSPLLVMNVLRMLQENTLRTTIAYFLCYANHGYLKEKFY